MARTSTTTTVAAFPKQYLEIIFNDILINYDTEYNNKLDLAAGENLNCDPYGDFDASAKCIASSAYTTAKPNAPVIVRIENFNKAFNSVTT